MTPSGPGGAPASGRPRLGPVAVRIMIVLVACLALAIPVVMAMAPSSAPSPLSAVGASAAPAASAQTDTDDDDDRDGAGKGNGWAKGWDKAVGPGKGNGWAWGRGGGAKGPITITAISGSNVSLATPDGWTRTIPVTAATTITKGGQTITVSGLAVGDEIRFKQTRQDDGTYTIDAIVVATPRAGGEVTAVGDSSITVTQRDGSSKVITVNGSTLYKLAGTAATKADVAVGLRIAVEGTVSGTTFTALTVHIEPAHAGGIVTARTASSITVTRKDGTTTVIHVSSATTYRIKGNTSATLADVAVGDRVEAVGSLRSDGSLDATAVGARGPKPDRGPNKDATPESSATPG